MTTTSLHLVVGVDYEDHINDRAYFKRSEAEARVKHLYTWSKLIPRNKLFDNEALELHEKAIKHFCEKYDFPTDMGEFVTWFKIETIELRGDQHDD